MRTAVGANRETVPDTGSTAETDSEIEIYAMPGHLVRRMHQVSQAIFDAEVGGAGFDLTPVQFAALSVIAARPGLDQASLAAAIAFDRPTTGGVVDRLEGKGLVRREHDASDRRVRRLFAEPAGRAVLDQVQEPVRRAQDRMLMGLEEDERALFLRLLGKALAAVGDAARPAGRNVGPRSSGSQPQREE